MCHEIRRSKKDGSAGERGSRMSGEKLMAEALAVIFLRGGAFVWRWLALRGLLLPLLSAAGVQNFVRVARQHEKGDDEDEEI